MREPSVIEREILRLLGNLPRAPMATDTYALEFIEYHAIMGRGIGYIDIHLPGSAMLAKTTRLWTRDKCLAIVARKLNLAYIE
uniref:Uncharacterized protein n=1 Tax=Candidatus Kentrum sp. MB TaxID=2138164 RepID=A0A450Y0A5_9GAMM|nr:MAG: hypothetical protein BECKMB1821G_GA0114241_11163 [Candidatus Kentron sp. MB]VFK34967.1 MAG: hypothetical protein BECKMB1821I_GA0114274_10939 [Candidatus Kentron sp. MB]VFK77070.1 MAG: hypothetical protein BECKMB1821H_GA0114242_10969 [Candidatus Kentron sp. MB]